jgi:hypothetical protein
MLPKAYDTLRALFQACLDLQEKEPALYRRLRLHFFGTTYDPHPEQGLVEPVAVEMGLPEIVAEQPARIPYLDALNLLCRADAIIGLGTSETHYTASKIFPCILARRPLLAMYHEASTVVEFVRRAGAGEVITYSDAEPVGTRIGRIRKRLVELLTSPVNTSLNPDLSCFAELTARAMAGRLAAVFDRLTDEKNNRKKTANQ